MLLRFIVVAIVVIVIAIIAVVVVIVVVIIVVIGFYGRTAVNLRGNLYMDMDILCGFSRQVCSVQMHMGQLHMQRVLIAYEPHAHLQSVFVL